MSLLAVLAAEDPSQSHHWLLPETKEIVFGGLAFLIILWLLIKFAWPPMKAFFKQRTETIQSELDQSAQALADAQAEAERIRAAKGDIEAERTRILAEADQQAAAVLADGRQRLEEEVADLRAKAEADIAAAQARSTEELQSEVALLASTATDRAVAESLDDATLQQLVEDYIQQVGVGGPS